MPIFRFHTLDMMMPPCDAMPDAAELLLMLCHIDAPDTIRYFRFTYAISPELPPACCRHAIRACFCFLRRYATLC